MFKTILFGLLFLSTLQAFSQNSATIAGNLSDQGFDREPLLFASVKIKETGKITQTNFHGNFEFKEVTPGTYTLEFSFLGYETEELQILVKADNTSRIQHQLKQKTIHYETPESFTTDALSTSKKTAVSSLNK